MACARKTIPTVLAGFISWFIIAFNSLSLFQDEAHNPKLQPPLPQGGPENYVVFATNSVFLEQNAEVLSGGVGVNDESPGPVLDSQVELTVGMDVTTPSGFVLKADRIRIKSGAQVASDVFCNELANSGSITGDFTLSLDLPLFSSLPPFHAAPAGTQYIEVANDESISLAAGDYGDIVVKAGGTILFTGGIYNLRSIDARDNTNLLFAALSEVRVADKFDADLQVFIGPAQNTSIDASDIIFYVAGINGASGNLGATPKAAQIGISNTVLANFYVPNGTLWLRQNTTATGAFWGKDVDAGIGVQVALDNGIIPVDTTPPVLMATSPIDGAITNATSITVSGTATDANALTVTVNGNAVSLGSNGAFTTVVALAEGSNVITVSATDIAGNNTTVVRTVIRDTASPLLTVIEPVDGSITSNEVAPIGGTVVDATTVTLTVNGDTLAIEPNGAFSDSVALLEGANIITFVATDATGNDTTATRLITRTSLPPDPAAVAPALDSTVTTTLHAATSFLYTGPNPIQTGVDPGAIDLIRVSVLRGKVLTRAGQLLSGVKITILNHPEFGQTLSRADGMFDLAVNGGGPLTVDYLKTGFIPVQRHLEVPWESFVALDAVIMTPPDSQATTIDFSEPLEMARGSIVSDGDGTRQATLMFEQGTTATMVLPDSSTQPLTTLTVRATELTVGETGPQAMPAQLPPASAYTYCVELTADEAMAAGAIKVQFSPPVPFYVEDFINFPAGTIVPAGYYDRTRGEWIASNNGLVIKIVGVADSLALIDTDGNGSANHDTTLARLGFTSAERRQLALAYSINQVLWRTEIPHFSTWDLNLGIAPPNDAVAPRQVEPQVPFAEVVNDEACGSRIGMQDQTLGESMAITGTPFLLHYQSNRTSGYASSRTLAIPLSQSASPLPASLLGIELTINVAGRTLTQSFPPVAGLEHNFTWDGKDAYGRVVRGAQNISTDIGYVYQGVYTRASRFGYSGNGVRITGTQGRLPLTLHQNWQGVINAPAPAPLGPSGWSLSVHHVYDFNRKVMFKGDGSQQGIAGRGAVVTRIAGGGAIANAPDGTAARDIFIPSQVHTSLYTQRGGRFAVSPEGLLYVIDNRRVIRIEDDGRITRFAGGGTSTADGDSARNYSFGTHCLYDLAFGPEGSLYISSLGLQTPNFTNAVGIVWRILPNGRIYKFAGGNPSAPNKGDGGPAVQAHLITAAALAVDADNNVYITEMFGHVVRRVTPDGIISTFAGNGTTGFSPPSGIATNVGIGGPNGVAVDPNGVVYIANVDNDRIRQVTPDGMLTTVAGTGQPGLSGDGGPATSGRINTPMDIALAPDGSFYIADMENNRIRAVSPEGVITTLGGNSSPGFGSNSLIPDEELVAQVPVQFPICLEFGPDRSLYFVSRSSVPGVGDAVLYRLRLNSPYPGSQVADFQIPSEDGSELYHFDRNGRHLRTTDALTHVTLYSFEYDSSNNLAGVRDLDNLLTHIERDSTGKPTAIVAPFGQRTGLTVDSTNFLTAIRNPAAETHSFEYDSLGLMLHMFDPKNNLYRFTYDSTGRLIKDEDPAGGFKSLVRTELANGFEVEMATAEGQKSKYRVERLANGGIRRTNTDATGLATVTIENIDGVTTTTSPEGTVSTVMQGPDPRFGMQAPLAKNASVRMPSGLQSNSQHKRVITQITNQQVTGVTDTLIINSRKYISAFDGNAKRFTHTSPEGRKTFAFIDSLGRVVQDSIAGVAAIEYDYNGHGFLTQAAQGGRASNFLYDAQGWLSRATDPLSRATVFVYDSVGRITEQTLPDTQQVFYAYDANGNLTSLTPPDKPAHLFDYTSVDLTQRYTPPLLNGDTTATRYEYDLDKRIIDTIRPDSSTVNVEYDSAGCGTCGSAARPKRITFDRGTLDFTYNSTTGLLTSLSAPGGNVLTYKYDGTLPKKVTWSGEVEGSVEVAYDNNFRVSSQKVNGGDSVSFQYDKDSLLKTAGGLTITRDPQNGRITGTTLGGVTTGQGYNNFGELEDFHAGFASDTLYKTVYAQDSLGRIAELTETIQGTTRWFNYSYDQTGRLSEVSRNDTLVSVYTYDANGNRLSRITPSDTVNGSYDAQDRLLTYGNAGYSYARNGELSMEIEGTDTTRYSYDAFGNLVKVIMPNGDIVQYVIDGQNRRIGKKVNGSLVKRWLYQNGLNVIAELDSNGNVSSRFVYGARPYVPDHFIKSGLTYRIISDHLSNVRLVVNVSTGTVAQRIDYDEFGNVVFDTNPGFQPFGHAGGLLDAHTSLTRFGARDYTAAAGRWTAKDPIQFAGGDANLYGYVLNDPINLIDPTGLAKLCNRSGQTIYVVAFGNDADPNDPQVAAVLENGGRTPEGADWDFYRFGEGENTKWYKFSIDSRVTPAGSPKFVWKWYYFLPGPLAALDLAGKIPREATQNETKTAEEILERMTKAGKLQQCSETCK